MSSTVQAPLPYTQEDLALIPPFLPSLTLIRVILVSSRYCRNEILDQHPNMEMNVAFENQVTVHVDAPSKQAWAFLDMKCKAIPASAEFKGKVPFEVEARIEVRYLSTQKDLDAEQFTKALNAFCHTTSLAHGWSFFRQHLVDAMSRMQLPPILLPLLINQFPLSGMAGTKPPSRRKPRKIKT